MFKKFCLTVVLVLSTVINALPPEWPAEYGDREAIHTQLTKIKGDLETRRKAKFAIGIYASLDLSEGNVNKILDAVGELIDLEVEQRSTLFGELKDNKKGSRAKILGLLTGALDYEKKEYMNMLGFCSMALQETGNSVYGFFDLLWHSRELYLAEILDLNKRKVGVVGRLNQFIPKAYLESDRLFYEQVSSSLFRFVAEKINGNSLVALRAQPKKLSRSVTPVVEDLNNNFRDLQEHAKNIRSIKHREILGERYDRFVVLENSQMGRTMKLFQRCRSKNTEVVPRAEVFATVAANQVFDKMLRSDRKSLEQRAEQMQLEREAAAAGKGGALGSAVPGAEGFSMFAVAAAMGLGPEDFNVGDETAAAADPKPKVLSDVDSSSDEEEW